MSARIATLGEVAKYVNGFAFKSDDWGDEGLRIIRIQNLNDPSKKYNRTTRTVKEELRVRQGDLLVSWSASLGVYEWTEPEDAWLNQHIFRVIPDHEKVEPAYLKRVLERVLDGLKSQAHGATMQHLTRGVFLNTEIPLPPIEEQQRIAAVLDAADELRAKRREALAKLDAITQAIFIEMFGHPRSPAEGVPRLTLGELTVSTRPICYGVLKPGPDIPDGVPLVRIVDMRGGTLQADDLHRISPDLDAEFSRSRLRGGEVLLSIQGTIGRVAVCPPALAGANISRTVALIQPDSRLSPRFLATWLALMEGRFETSGSTRASLNIGTIRKMEVPVPPLEAQQKFERRHESLLSVIATAETSAEELDQLFASLEQRAFRGEL